MELNDRCGYHNCSLRIRKGNRIFILMDIIFFPKIIFGLIKGHFGHHRTVIRCDCKKAEKIRKENYLPLMNYQAERIKDGL